MKNLRALKFEVLLKNERIAIEGGSVNPDRLREYSEERYGEITFPRSSN